jgi:protein arginine kinase activator
MLCQVCKKSPAKVHYTQMGENEVRKIDLCPACAKEKGVNDPSTFGLADVILGLGAVQKMEEATESAGGETTCRHCGYTQSDFKKTGRLGCPECYQTFAEGLEAMLKGMHKGTQHKGKTPPAVRRALDLQARLARLEADLKAAIEKENFEIAASLRDEIKQTKAEIHPA